MELRLSCTNHANPMILCVRPANVRLCYNVTASLIGWTHTQNDPCFSITQMRNFIIRSRASFQYQDHLARHCDSHYKDKSHHLDLYYWNSYTSKLAHIFHINPITLKFDRCLHRTAAQPSSSARILYLTNCQQKWKWEFRVHIFVLHCFHCTIWPTKNYHDYGNDGRMIWDVQTGVYWCNWHD